jgi:hypothetical protein
MSALPIDSPPADRVDWLFQILRIPHQNEQADRLAVKVCVQREEAEEERARRSDKGG